MQYNDYPSREEYKDFYGYNRQQQKTIRKKQAQADGKSHPIWHFCLMACYLVILLALGGTGLLFYYISSAPKINQNAMANDNAIRIFDNRGHLIDKLESYERDYVPYKQVPRGLVNSLTSIEDRHFFQERGVDPIRIGEAEAHNLFGHSGTQGGSTLTQQLVKLSVFSTSAKDKTLKRKAQEAYLALRVDHAVPKDKILEYYINKVYMGHNTYGMQTASRYYFGKNLNQLSVPQTAMLAGMPQSPIGYDPYMHPKAATERRDDVIKALYTNHKINAEQEHNAFNTSIKKGLVYKHPETKRTKAQKIANDYVKQTLTELSAEHFDTSQGLNVYTNLNMKDQARMYQMANGSKKPGWPSNGFQVGSALVNSKTGAVEAMLGGRKSGDDAYGINRAVATGRSNGSTNKPLMDYGPAMQYLNYKPDRVVYDTPFVYPGTHIELQDFDHRYEGAISLRSALVQSRNVPAIRALQSVSVPKARKFMDGLGLPTNPKQTSLQNGIGGYISPLQEAAAYAAFANGGIYHQPLEINRVTLPTGKTVHVRGASHRAMSVKVARQMNNVLEGVPKSDDGDHAKVPGLTEAGKTGTTQYPSTYKYHLPNYAAMDSWYEGYTPNLSMSVWTGYDKPMEPNHYINANEINVAQAYYKYVMEVANQGLPKGRF